MPRNGYRSSLWITQFALGAPKSPSGRVIQARCLTVDGLGLIGGVVPEGLPSPCLSFLDLILGGNGGHTPIFPSS